MNKHIPLLALMLLPVMLIKTQPLMPFKDFADLQTEATRISKLRDKTTQANQAASAINRLAVTQPRPIGSIQIAKQLYHYITNPELKQLMGRVIASLEEIDLLTQAFRQRESAPPGAREVAGPSEPRPITPPITPSVPSIAQINAMTLAQLKSITQTQINLMSEDQSMAYMLKLSSLEQEVQRTKEQDPIQHYYQGILQVNDVHAVGPGVLQMLINNGCLFVYFKALSQTGVTCGYHAGLNAFALQQLFSQKKVINSKNIQEIVRKEYNDPEYQAFCTFGDRPHEMLPTDIYPYLFGENTAFIWDEAKQKFTDEIIKEIKGRHVTNAYVLGTKTDLMRLADSEDPSF